ncbi:MAG TPA: efflux RND transporter periplasmic adaptor subunit [Thermoanaerobaculia bacterium]|nr:efflux RND transporter periplasmic adaptor subunit [Thermoanaerobaculia bacterium]
MMRKGFTFIAVLVVALAALGCKKQEAKAQTTATHAAPPLPADVQSVAAAANGGATPSATQTENGAIAATGEFVSPIRSELAAKIPGRVAAVYVDEGSRVSKGQPVLALETDYVRLNLQRAEADAARARAMADDAQKDVARKKDLIAKNAVPQATMDRSQSAYDQASAGYQSAQAQVALLRQQLADSVVRSPIDGVVASKRTDVGQRLADNTVALVVQQTSPLKLRFRVPERYLANVRKGQSVKASVDPYPGQVFEGKVTVVGGVIDPSTRSLLVETEFPNRDGKLRPGMFARVELQPAG